MFSCDIFLYSINVSFHHQTHAQLRVVSDLAQLVHSSVATSNCPPLFPSSMLDTVFPGGLIFQCHIFLPFHTFHWVLESRILEWVAVSFYSVHNLSELFIMTHPSWLALQSMVHSFVKLCKFLCHNKSIDLF